VETRLNRRMLQASVLATGIAATAAALWWPGQLSGKQFLLGLVFVALTVALQQVERRFGPAIAVSGEITAVLLAFMVGGPVVAALAAISSSLVLQLRLGSPPARIAFAPAALMTGLGLLFAIHWLLLGPVAGARLAIELPGGAPDLVFRYLLAQALGAVAFAFVSRTLFGFYRLAENRAGERPLRSAGEAAGGTLLVLPLLIAVTFAVAEMGTVAVIFIIPSAGAVWGVVVLMRARLSGRRISVALRLSAFFSAALGTVFVLLAGLVLGTFAIRYSEAVVAGQELLGGSTVLTLEEVVRRGESLRVSLVPEATLHRLLEQSPSLAYAVLLELRAGDRRPIRSAFRPQSERFRQQVERDLETVGRRGTLRWESGNRRLTAENVVVPVLNSDRVPVAELHLGIDVASVGEQVSELGLLLGGVTLLLFAVLLLLLRQYAGRGLVLPLREVRAALERIAGGDSDMGDRLEVAGDQEIAEVALHFNAFADRLVEIIRETRATALENATLFEQQKETTERLRHQAEELEAAYEQLWRSKEQLLVSEKMAALGKLTAGIAHEINSPLGGILNSLEMGKIYAEEYRKSVGDPEVSAADHEAIAGDLLGTLQMATAATQKVAQFVRTIKGQTRMGDERSEPFDPAAEIESTLVLLQHEFKHRAVKVNTELDEGLLLVGDPGKFSLVVQNLVSNAVDAYGAGDPAVWIRLRREDAAAVLEVEDRGSGIPEEIRPRIFDYLFTTKDVGKGTGLGLSMVYSIVTGHFGGEVSLDTEIGRGTLFRIQVPLDGQPPPDGTTRGGRHRSRAETLPLEPTG
jgi:signal transduction histidine kinase